MFLYNILTGGSSSSVKQESAKYDKISFKINLSDNIPQFYECSSEKVQQQQQLTPQHPLYQRVFGLPSKRKSHELKTAQIQVVTQPKKQYQQYKTTQNDTLSGIAIKLDISEKVIRQLNDISGRIYPGMTIKLPLSTDLTKLQDQPLQALQKIRISKLLSNEYSNVNTQKIQAQYYAGTIGYIKGSLSLNKNYLIFNPSLQDKKNLQNFTVQKLLKFNAIVQTIDIQDVLHMDIPQMSQENSEHPQHDHLIKIFLFTVGNNKIEKKYKERLKKLKIQEKAIASIEFSLRCHKEQACKYATTLVDKIKTVILQLKNMPLISQKKDQKRLTNIPFFDIIHENIHPKIQQQMQDIAANSQSQMSPSKIAILGMLNEPSQILTDTQFQNLAKKLPILYQLNNWDRIYSSTHNGSSFATFMNKAKNQEPVILLIKQYKGYSFGAFLVESLETGKTGRGQMFIFTFKDGSTPQIFKWTSKNQFFVYIQKQSGIGIGMGLKYGLYLDQFFQKGSSSSSFTFGNEEGLSKKQYFMIEQVELWSIDTSY